MSDGLLFTLVFIFSIFVSIPIAIGWNKLFEEKRKEFWNEDNY